MTRCESYPPCFGTIYFPTAPFSVIIIVTCLTIFIAAISKLDPLQDVCLPVCWIL